MITVFEQHLARAVDSLILFGSRSRGDSDANSDIDLAVFAAAESLDALFGIKQEMCAAFPQIEVNFSVYSMATADLMATQGSLYLWHLKLEGKILFKRSNWIEGLFQRLAPYSRPKAEMDLATFQSVLDDVDASLRWSKSTMLFEAATLFSVLRSLGMIVTTLAGSPCFGRLEPISRTRELMGRRFRLNEQEINALHEAKLVYSRQKSFEPADLVNDWCMDAKDKTVEVLDFAKELAHESAR